MSTHGLIICRGMTLPKGYDSSNWCSGCNFSFAHTAGDYRAPELVDCYKPQPIDEEVYRVVQEEYEEWGKNKIKWRTYGIPEEGSFARTGWDSVVQRQIEIHKEEEAQKCLMTSDFVLKRLTYS